MFRQEQQKVLIMSVISCIPSVVITDVINLIVKPEKKVPTSSVGGISTC